MLNIREDVRKRAAMTFFVAFLAVQIVIATVALFGPRPARWSWQMYSGVKTQAEFVIVRENGAQDSVELTDYVGNPRGDIDLVETLPPYICQVEPDAAAIRMTPPRDGAATEVRCKR